MKMRWSRWTQVAQPAVEPHDQRSERSGEALSWKEWVVGVAEAVHDPEPKDFGVRSQVDQPGVEPTEDHLCEEGRCGD